MKIKIKYITILIMLLLSGITLSIAADPLEQVASKGTIRGVITNDNSEPLFFVRVIAIGEKTTTGRAIGFALTHLILGGKGSYEMEVEPGRYILIRAAKLPLYIGAKAGPIVVEAGEIKTLDLSLTYIGSFLPIN
jgi:hypothetical protein